MSTMHGDTGVTRISVENMYNKGYNFEYFEVKVEEIINEDIGVPPRGSRLFFKVDTRTVEPNMLPILKEKEMHFPEEGNGTVYVSKLAGENYGMEILKYPSRGMLWIGEDWKKSDANPSYPEDVNLNTIGMHQRMFKISVRLVDSNLNLLPIPSIVTPEFSGAFYCTPHRADLSLNGSPKWLGYVAVRGNRANFVRTAFTRSIPRLPVSMMPLVNYMGQGVPLVMTIRQAQSSDLAYQQGNSASQIQSPPISQGFPPSSTNPLLEDVQSTDPSQYRPTTQLERTGRLQSCRSATEGRTIIRGELDEDMDSAQQPPLLNNSGEISLICQWRSDGAQTEVIENILQPFRQYGSTAGAGPVNQPPIGRTGSTQHQADSHVHTVDTVMPSLCIAEANPELPNLGEDRSPQGPSNQGDSGLSSIPRRRSTRQTRREIGGSSRISKEPRRKQ